MSGGNLALLIWIGGWLITWLPLAYAMECGRQKGNTWGKGPRGRTTCDLQKKNAEGQELYAKNYFGTSWQLTWTATQDTGVAVSDAHYQFILRPSTLIPGVNVQ
jgi:hypothetical protein